MSRPYAIPYTSEERWEMFVDVDLTGLMPSGGAMLTHQPLADREFRLIGLTPAGEWQDFAEADYRVDGRRLLWSAAFLRYREMRVQYTASVTLPDGVAYLAVPGGMPAVMCRWTLA